MPEIKRVEIDSACCVNAIKDDRFKTGVISIDMYLPYDEKSAAARCMVPNIIVRACRRYPDYTSLTRRLARLYGASLRSSTGMFGDWHKMTVGISFLDDRYALDGDKVSGECTRLLFEMLFDPMIENGEFKHDDVETERRLLLERIDAQKNDRIQYARLRCIKHLCADEPYGKESYGSREQVETTGGSDMARAWKEMISHARFEVVAAGSFDVDVVADIVREVMGKADRQPCTLPCQMISEAGELKRITERMDVQQAKLVSGWRTRINTDEGDYEGAKLASIILGGISNSLLFSNVREKLSLCYYCSAVYIRTKGIMLIQSGVEEDNAEKAENAINEQVRSLCAGEFSDDLLRQAKMAIMSACREVNDSINSISEWYSSQVFDKDIISPEEYIERIAAVTRERVVAAANTFAEDTVYLLAGTEGQNEQ